MIVCLAAPAVAEGFAQRCVALAQLDGLPPIAPDAVRSLAATHGPQLRALLADGPAAADPLAVAPGQHEESASAAIAQQAASSLDWQVAAASRRSPAVTRHGAGPASAAASSLTEQADAAPVQASGQAGSQPQGPEPGGASGDILDSLEVCLGGGLLLTNRWKLSVSAYMAGQQSAGVHAPARPIASLTLICAHALKACNAMEACRLTECHCHVES